MVGVGWRQMSISRLSVCPCVSADLAYISPLMVAQVAQVAQHSYKINDFPGLSSFNDKTI